MKTITIYVYSFFELSKKIQKRIFDTYPDLVKDFDKLNNACFTRKGELMMIEKNDQEIEIVDIENEDKNG